MIKKVIKVTGVLLLVGFSFFYTEKVTKIIKEKDPIMIKLNEVKNNSYIQTIKPIINSDEYITGINGCEVDIDESYNKMKTLGEFKNELIVMKEVKNNDNLKNKYIVGGNKLEKNVSIIFLLKDDINDELLKFLTYKRIITNFFVDQKYLENNTVTVKFLSENNNIYYLGNNLEYEDEYMIYSKNLISMNSNNESNFCIVEDKNDEVLKLCSEYDMSTIKTKIFKDNIFNNVKENLNNGSIIAIDSDDIDKIKVSINYILSKGYNIVSLDELLNQSNTCNKYIDNE